MFGSFVRSRYQVWSEYIRMNDYKRGKNLFQFSYRNTPVPQKQQKFTASTTANDDYPCGNAQEIPHILQGEIARLDQKFKISIDSSSQIGSKLIKLVCCLDDKHLPCVPPVSVTIPGNYSYLYIE